MGIFSKLWKGITNLIGDVIGFLVGADFDDQSQAEGVLLNKSSNIANIPVIYGTRKVGGTRVFLSTGGNDNEYLYMALVLCEGRVSSIGDVYINDTLSTDSKFSGLVSIEKYTGRDDQTYSTLLAGATDTWGTNHRLRGVAYLAIRLKYDQDVFGSIPDIQAIVNGRRTVDPRGSATAASGISAGEEYEIASVGTTDFTAIGARANIVGVQFTATGSAPSGTGTVRNFAFYKNPAIALRDYLINNRYGKGLYGAQINDTAFSAAANVCDALVTEYSGSTNSIKLLECHAVIDTGKQLFDNVKILLQGMRGLMPFQDGQYSLLIDAAAPAGTPFRLDSSNITSDITVTASGKNKKYNRVRAKFVNPEANWQEDSVDWPPNPDTGDTTYTTFLSEDNGEELLRDVTLNTITNYYSARDLARIICRASREHQLTVQLTATSEALEIAVGDVVELEHDSLGWTGAAIQDFRVLNMQLQEDGEVKLTLQEYTNVYTWDEGPQEGDSLATTLPDPFDVEPPSGLSLTQGVNVAEDGSAIPYLDIAFTTSRDVFVTEYIIRVVPSGFDPFEVRLTTSAFSAAQLAGTTPVAYLVSPALVTTYTVSVRAINDANVRSTAISGTIAITGDTTPPSAITLGSAVGGVNSVRLAWTNPSNSDYAYARIQRRVSGVGSYVSIDDVFGQPSAAGSFVDLGLADNTTYQYRAYAYDWSNNQSSVSNVVSATTSVAPVVETDLLPREVHNYVYYQTAQASAPSTPSASDYDYGAAAGTNPFTGLTSGWGINAPTPSTNTANTGDPFWVSRFYVTENEYNGTVTVEFSTPFQSTVFDGLVTFKNLNTELADSASSLLTTIDGGLIRTGVVDLANQAGMAVRQAKTSFSSTTAGFFLGNDSGTAKFNIGDANQKLTWDGSNLITTGITVKTTDGTIMLDANGLRASEGNNLVFNGSFVYGLDGWDTTGSVSVNTTLGRAYTDAGENIASQRLIPVSPNEPLYIYADFYGASGFGQLVFYKSDGSTYTSYTVSGSLWSSSAAASQAFRVAKIDYPSYTGNPWVYAIAKFGTVSGGSATTWHQVGVSKTPPVIDPSYASTYIRDLSVDTLQIAGSAITVPDGTSQSISKSLTTSYQKMGELTVDYGSADTTPEGLIVVCGLQVPGDGSTDQGIQIEIRRVYSTNSYNGEHVTQSVKSDFGHTITMGAHFLVSQVGTATSVTLELHARLGSEGGTRSANRFFITSIASKR